MARKNHEAQIISWTGRALYLAAGAGGIIGMEIAKDANPDGYTLIAATTAASTIARLLVKSNLPSGE